MKDIFEQIYSSNSWKDNYGTASGPGSAIECSKEYLLFLQNYVKQNNIVSILDLGCGDFNLMRHFNFDNVQYLGLDIVSTSIEYNRINYSKQNIKFQEMDIFSFKSSDKFDLVILKEVLQHFSNDSIIKLLTNIDYAKNLIIINDITDDNIDCIDGGYRPINLNKYPFNFNYEKIFEYDSCGFIKNVNLTTFQ